MTEHLTQGELAKLIEELAARVKELERRVYGYDFETKEPLLPHKPKPIP